ncbi:MAG: hypothetical protein RL076_2585 [Chloroflexota bacterium]
MIPPLSLPPLRIHELLLAREVAIQLGHQTHAYVSRGWYPNAYGMPVDLAPARDATRQARVTYRPGMPIPVRPFTHFRATTHVYNQTTLAVAQARAAQGYRVAILNFASALSPGGGWLQGARAQEESLARASALVYAIHDDPWYRDVRHHRNPFYDDTVIVTPQVPFFRTHTGQLLDAPWHADVLTAAAVHADAVRRHMPSRASEIPLAMATRAHVVLQVAATLPADVLVLGAWGCGAFGNAPEVVVAAFLEALARVNLSQYALIEFAVADLRTPQSVLMPFMRQWGGSGTVYGGSKHR